MTPEHILVAVALATLLGSLLLALIRVVRGVTKVQVTVESLSSSMAANTTATAATALTCSRLDSRVSRIEGRLMLGHLPE